MSSHARILSILYSFIATNPAAATTAAASVISTYLTLGQVTKSPTRVIAIIMIPEPKSSVIRIIRAAEITPTIRTIR